MRTTRFLLLPTIALLIGCARPVTDGIHNMFLREHPDYTVLSVRASGREAEATNFHIRYRCPNEQSEHEDVWRMARQGGTISQKTTLR